MDACDSLIFALAFCDVGDSGLCGLIDRYKVMQEVEVVVSLCAETCLDEEIGGEEPCITVSLSGLGLMLRSLRHSELVFSSILSVG